MLKNPRARAGGRPPVSNSSPEAQPHISGQREGGILTSRWPAYPSVPSRAGSPVHMAAWMFKTLNNLKSPIQRRASTEPKSFMTQQPSPCTERQNWDRFECRIIVYIFVQGKSGIIYGNSDVANRCCSEKENVSFCLRVFEDFFLLVWCSLCSLEKRAECLLQNTEQLHPNKMNFSWGMGFIGYLPLLDFGTLQKNC